jgi:PBP1b-binding outer membrane lipoprotein LpoB
MKKLIWLMVLAVFFTGCSASKYVGEWKGVSPNGEKCDLILNEDGTVLCKFKEGVKEGTWKEEKDGTISLTAPDVKAKLKIMNDKLVLDTIKKGRIHFTRQAVRNAATK